ncbi:MAG: hypothetical protein AB1938_04640 [Myxococcota bacterium]
MTPRVSRPQVSMCAVVVLAMSACGEEAFSPAPSGTTVAQFTPRAESRGAALWGASVTTLPDGQVAVARTDSDEVVVVDAVSGEVRRRASFEKGSRPTRLVATGPDAFAVVLRGSGEVALVPPLGRATRLAACAEPRGLAFDDTNERLWVACADGALVSVQGGKTHAVQVGEELRDVFLVKGRLWVTAFRTAELLEVDTEGQVLTRLTPSPQVVARTDEKGDTTTLGFTPRIALRAVVEDTRVVMVHQEHLDDDVTKLTVPPGSTPPPVTPPYYGLGTGCGTSVVSSALTGFDLEKKEVTFTAPIAGSVVLDVAFAGGVIALTQTGSGAVTWTTWDGASNSACLGTFSTLRTPTPVGVGLSDTGGLLVLDHDGTLLMPGHGVVALTDVPEPLDEPRAFFHRDSPSGVACASCHVEGYDDGHTWNFEGKVVRTQTLAGGLSATAPYHWKGELPTISAVLHSTFERRMGGTLSPSLAPQAVESWLDTLPARAGKRGDIVAGQAIFQQAGCGSCHAGDRLTTNATVDVGTGGAFQVPSLRGLKARGPWMHDGCAKTLAQRFDEKCGGARHGAVAAGDVPALVKYLESL